jgi:hypothetical protein
MTGGVRETGAMRVGAWLSGMMKRSRLKRFGVIAVAVLAALLTIAGISIRRSRSLGDLPDVGDPFDVAAAVRPIEIPDDENAFVSYSEAGRLLAKRFPAFRQTDWTKLTWSNAGPEVRSYLESSRPALAVWSEGSERPDAVYHQPGKVAADTALPIVQDLRTLSQMAALECSRLEEAGAMAEAWTWYKNMLRASRHVGRHGSVIERWLGARDFDYAARRIIPWAADPRVDAALLRRALADTLASDALTPPLSVSMKRQYLLWQRDLDELRVMVNTIPLPGGQNGWLEKALGATKAKAPIQRARLTITNDVERSRRVLRLLYANWLPQMDKPANERAPIAIRSPTLIYASDATAPAAARAVAPEVLDAVIGQTLLAHEFFRPPNQFREGGPPWSGWAWEGDSPLAREPRRRAVLIVKLAAELYRREHGRPPANAGALLDGCLKELPNGISRDDPIPAGIE